MKGPSFWIPAVLASVSLIIGLAALANDWDRFWVVWNLCWSGFFASDAYRALREELARRNQ